MTDGVFGTFIRFADRNIYQYNFEFGAEDSVQMTFSFFSKNGFSRIDAATAVSLSAFTFLMDDGS